MSRFCSKVVMWLAFRYSSAAYYLRLSRFLNLVLMPRRHWTELTISLIFSWLISFGFFFFFYYF